MGFEHESPGVDGKDTDHYTTTTAQCTKNHKNTNAKWIYLSPRDIEFDQNVHVQGWILLETEREKERE